MSHMYITYSTQYACTFILYIAPEAVLDLMVTTAERSALLEASPPPVSNGIIISYTVLYNVNGSANMMTINFTAVNQQLNNTVGSLLPFTNYVFTVRACTIAGCGPPSDSVTATTLEDCKLALYVLLQVQYHHNSEKNFCFDIAIHINLHKSIRIYTKLCFVRALIFER